MFSKRRMVVLESRAMLLSRVLVGSFTCGLLLIGCGSSQTRPAESAPPAETEPGEEELTSAPERPSITAEACESSGGTVVGDIGDGAIHKPDYLCPSGAKPSGNISAPEGGPVAVEGSVCCPG